MSHVQQQDDSLPFVLTHRKTAEVLQMSYKHWSRKWKLMIATEHFPPPLPRSGRRPKWSRDLVLQWIESNGRPQLEITRNDEAAFAKAMQIMMDDAADKEANT